MRRDQSNTGSDYRRQHNREMWDRPCPGVYFRETHYDTTTPEGRQLAMIAAVADLGPDFDVMSWENEGGAHA